jgi:hypothetical protein
MEGRLLTLMHNIGIYIYGIHSRKRLQTLIMEAQ